LSVFSFLFFFTASASPEIYTLSLHDALPISVLRHGAVEWFTVHVNGAFHAVEYDADEQVLVAGNPWRIGQGWKAPRGTATVALVAGTAIRIVDPRAAGELSSAEDVALRMGLSYVVSRLLALFHRREVFCAE